MIRIGRCSIVPLALAAFPVAGYAQVHARAPEACVSETKNDFVNFTYDPARPFSGRNGFLSVLASDAVGADDHLFDSATRTVSPPLTRPTTRLEAVANYDILEGHARIDGFAFGEVGIELLIEARNSSGTLLCTGRKQFYIARAPFENGQAPIGRGDISCGIDLDHSGPVTIELTAHAWSTFGGLGGASALLDVQIVDFGVESCTGSCDSTCAPVTRDGGTCFCDDLCSYYGDCCADAADVCQLDSCWEQCGGASAGGSCWCDDLCTTYGDCCSDIADSCT